MCEQVWESRRVWVWLCVPTPTWRASEEGTPPLRVGVLSPFCVQPPARPTVWAALASQGRICRLTPLNRTVVAKGPLGYLTLLIFPQRGLWSAPICACGPAQPPTGSAVPWSPTHSPPQDTQVCSRHVGAPNMWGRKPDALLPPCMALRGSLASVSSPGHVVSIRLALW